MGVALLWCLESGFVSSSLNHPIPPDVLSSGTHTWGLQTGLHCQVAVPHPGELCSPQPLLAPQALLETALTRVVLPMPILVLPPIVMSMLEK